MLCTNVGLQAFQYLAGAALMVLYLAVDGLTSTWQDSLFQGYNMTIADQVGEATGVLWRWPQQVCTPVYRSCPPFPQATASNSNDDNSFAQY
jgi:hypothetical protein